MLKNFAITPPLLGRISIGKLVEKNGKRLPEKDDAFTITTQVQNKDGWIQHPLHQSLSANAPGNKLRAIPVKMLFNRTDLNLRAEYTLFDRSNGRPWCMGDGEQARRLNETGSWDEIPCPSPDACPLGSKQGCKPYGRLNVQIDGQDDEVGTFIFRTTGYNSIRTLTARLKYYSAISTGMLSGLPLMLRLRAKSTTQSHRAPVYYVDLTLRDGMKLPQALNEALLANDAEAAWGFDRDGFEESAWHVLNQGATEDNSEDVPEIVAELFEEDGVVGNTAVPAVEGEGTGDAGKKLTPDARQGSTTSLKDKLLDKVR